MTQTWYTDTRTAAFRLQLNVESIRYLLRAGAIAACKAQGRWYISKNGIERFDIYRKVIQHKNKQLREDIEQ